MSAKKPEAEAILKLEGKLKILGTSSPNPVEGVCCQTPSKATKS